MTYMERTALNRLNVQLGFDCNNNCLFCSQSDIRAQNEYESPASIHDILVEGAASGKTHVAFLGGEPTIQLQLLEWVGKAKTLGYDSILIQTNGRRLAYQSYVNELIEAGVTHLDISLHGPTPAIHEFHTQVPNSFTHTVKGLMNATKSAMVVGVTTVVTRSNFRHLTTLTNLLAKVGVRRWHMSATHKVGAAIPHYQRLIPRLAMIRPDVREALQLASTLKINTIVTGMPKCAFPDANTPLGGLELSPTLGAYGPACDSCTAKEGCPGLDQDYLIRFGDADLIPQTEERIDPTIDQYGLASSFVGIGYTEA